jgi:hypothetical protein
MNPAVPAKLCIVKNLKIFISGFHLFFQGMKRLKFFQHIFYLLYADNGSEVLMPDNRSKIGNFLNLFVSMHRSK